MTTTVPPERLQEWVPGKLLLSADGRGWSQVGLRSYHYQGQDVLVPALSDYMLVAYRRGVTPMQRRFEGRWKNDTLGPGAVSLLTRAQQAEWAWTEPVVVTHLYLSPMLLSAVASEAMDCQIDQVELADVLRTDDPVLTHVVDAIAAEAGQEAMGGALYVESVARALCIHLLRRYASVTLPVRPEFHRLTPGEERRIRDYIEDHLASPLTLAGMAENLGMTTDLFARRFRATFGRPPYRYVMERRVARARILLAQGILPVKEIAGICGFSDQSHLTRIYVRETGVSPAAFRKLS